MNAPWLHFGGAYFKNTVVFGGIPVHVKNW
jgi:hypothetical protein